MLSSDSKDADHVDGTYDTDKYMISKALKGAWNDQLHESEESLCCLFYTLLSCWPVCLVYLENGFKTFNLKRFGKLGKIMTCVYRYWIHLQVNFCLS